jgi:hypothetical protein
VKKPQKSLKEQNAWLIRAALLGHAVGFVFVLLQGAGDAPPGAADLMKKIKEMALPGTLSLGIIALTRLVLLGLISPTMRDRVVHWKWKHPLPGARAFSQIGPGDPRVNMQRLRELYGKLPIAAAKQSQLFYTIYKKHENEVAVLDAHKSYLAARDIATINLILLFVLPVIAVAAIHSIKLSALYALVLLIAYAATCWAAQAYGTRLVQNSLAVASQAK